MKTTTKHEGQGQSGPKIVLAPTDLNKDELKVYETLKRTTKGKSIADLSELFRGAKEKTNSRVRNALRRLVRSELAKKVDRGTYIAGKGRSRAARSGSSGRSVRARNGSKKTAEAAKPKGPRLVPAPPPTPAEISSKAASIGIRGATADQRMLIAMHVLKDAKSSTKIAQAAGLSRGYVIPRLKRLISSGADVGFLGAILSQDLVDAHLATIASPRAA